MRKNIHCDYFGKNDFIYFNYGRLAQLEELLSKSILFYVNGQLTIDFLAKAYFVGLQHCHKNVTIDWYLDKFDDLELSMEELSAPIIKAIVMCGFFGKKAATAVAEAVEELDAVEKND